AGVLGPVVPGGGPAHRAGRRPGAGLPDRDRLGDGRAARVGGRRARRLGDRPARPRDRQRRVRGGGEPDRCRGPAHLLGPVVRGRPVRARHRARVGGPRRDAGRGLRPRARRGGAARLAVPARPAHRRVRRPAEAPARLTAVETPASQGYRWPAEWEPHRATWLSWPHSIETWPDGLPAVHAAFGAMVAALAPHETVEIGVGDDALEETAR